ncbi:MaoC/PaaZ C-terminal domain-containing protein, partial [Staphylococcus aureus]
MYCGASGDFNVIHWNERIATAVGLPNVIAHGMFTMAQAARVLTDFVGDPSRVIDYGVRFTKPVPVPDDDIGTAVEVTGTISEKRDDGTIVVDL